MGGNQQSAIKPKHQLVCAETTLDQSSKSSRRLRLHYDGVLKCLHVVSSFFLEESLFLAVMDRTVPPTCQRTLHVYI